MENGIFVFGENGYGWMTTTIRPCRRKKFACKNVFRSVYKVHYNNIICYTRRGFGLKTFLNNCIFVI